MYLWFCSSAGGAVPELSLLMGENKGLYGRNQGHGSAAEDTALQGSLVCGDPEFFMGVTQASLSVCDSSNLTPGSN